MKRYPIETLRLDDAHKVNFIIDIGPVRARTMCSNAETNESERVDYTLEVEPSRKEIVEIKIKEILESNCWNWFRYS